MPARLHGDDLIGEVLRNMEEGLFRIRGKTIVPAIYRIYLNTEDFEPFRDVVPFIAGEIRAALDDRLAKWNQKPLKFAAGLLKKTPLNKTVDDDFTRIGDAWTVEIYPDLDGKLQRGEIEVYSELGAPKKAEYGAGSLTRRIFPNKPESVPDSAPTMATPAPSSTSVPEGKSEKEPGDEKDDSTKGRAFAYLRYAGQGGQKEFEVTKNQTVIGRGGRSYWVDLKLETLPDVSREHCRIRRDPQTGRFIIEDVSQFGTAVNGKPVGRNASAELPNRATISLAGVIDLQWESA
ncbi:MAG TPA: FHA domain-containing protein [Bryobacteraceae bacterium]|jgi:predicted component of type VI protein secretion system|nr:FHA domain-containing protein [Bryobacteraceae bacterium]